MYSKFGYCKYKEQCKRKCYKEKCKELGTCKGCNFRDECAYKNTDVHVTVKEATIEWKKTLKH